jgi:hypothetical protein
MEGKIDAVRTAVDAALSLHMNKELRGAVQLSVVLAQPGKRRSSADAAGGISFLEQATLTGSAFATSPRRLAAFRVALGTPLELTLSVDAKDSTDLRIKAIERVECAGCSYLPAEVLSRRRRCCGGAALSSLGLGVRDDAVLFGDDDVEIPHLSPKSATITISLPDDAGPAGELLTLKLRLWISFLASPALGFESGKTVAVTQSLYLAVYKSGSRKMMLRELEDRVALSKHGLGAAVRPVLALPLLVHHLYLKGTEDLLKQQLVGWSDGSRLTLA